MFPLDNSDDADLSAAAAPASKDGQPAASESGRFTVCLYTRSLCVSEVLLMTDWWMIQLWNNISACRCCSHIWLCLVCLLWPTGKQFLKVFDGDDAVKRGFFRLVSITKNEEVVVRALLPPKNLTHTQTHTHQDRYYYLFYHRNLTQLSWNTTFKIKAVRYNSVKAIFSNMTQNGVRGISRKPWLILLLSKTVSNFDLGWIWILIKERLWNEKPGFT